MRDLKRFPDDENGDSLWYMKEQGDDLTIAREIDFSVTFPEQDRALAFAMQLLKSGMKVSYSEELIDGAEMIDVIVHKFMLPTHEEVTLFETQLGVDAERFEGRNDGWGSMMQG